MDPTEWSPESHARGWRKQPALRSDTSLCSVSPLRLPVGLASRPDGAKKGKEKEGQEEAGDSSIPDT